MKTVSTFLKIAVVLISLWSPALAQQPTLTLAEGRLNDLMTLKVTGLGENRTEIAVLGADGRPWFSKYLWKQAEYRVGLDLRLLPAGDYLVVVSNREGRTARAFHLEGRDVSPYVNNGAPVARRVSVSGAASERLLAQVSSPAGGRALDLNLANLGQTPAVVRLVSLDGIPVFEKKITDSNGYAGRLDLNHLAAGEYFLFVRSADASFFQFLRIGKDAVTLTGAQSWDARDVRPLIVARQ